MNRVEKDMYLICTFLLFFSFFGVMLLKSPDVGISGAVILEEAQIKSEFKYVTPDNMTRENALTSLLKAEEDLSDMINYNLSTYFINDTLLKAKRIFIGDNINQITSDIEKETNEFRKSYLKSLLKVAEEIPQYEVEKLNYSEIFRLTQLIDFKKQQAYRIIDTISLIEEKEKQLKENKVYSLEASTLLEEAKISFNEERYDEVEAYLKEVDIKLDKASSEKKRVKELITLGKNFFEKYWWQVIFSIVILVIITPITVKKIRIMSARKKLQSLNLELQTINKLFKRAQEDCFKDRNISEATYKIRVERYRIRMTEIKHTIPVLESIISGKTKVIRKEPEERKGILEVKK